MGLLDRLFGSSGDQRGQGVPQDAPSGRAPQDTPRPPRSAEGRAGGDEAAIERYRYLLRTAPPEAIEQAHAEAFATLTPEQRRTVLTELGRQVPASERAASDDPSALARMATRAEMRQPGLLERTFSGRGGMGGGYGMGGGLGMGGLLAGGLFASMAGAFVGTAIADEMFDDHDGHNDAASNDGNDNDDGSSNDGGGNDGGGAQSVGDVGNDGQGDYGQGDYGDGGYGGGDAFDGFGGGDFGGNAGGGDFGGGFDA